MKGWYIVKQTAKIINKLPVCYMTIVAGPYGNLLQAQHDALFKMKGDNCIFMVMEYIDEEE